MDNGVGFHMVCGKVGSQETSHRKKTSGRLDTGNWEGGLVWGGSGWEFTHVQLVQAEKL